MGEIKPIREIETTIDKIEGSTINIGRVYENKVTKLLVDLSSTLIEHPNATASLVVRQPNWQSYPATVTLNGMTLEWLITDAEIGLQSGTGEIQITVADGEQIYKSAIAQTVILPSILYKSGSIPDPIAHWISQAQTELEKTKEALNTAQNFIADLKQKLDNGELNGKPGPQGEKGEKGDPGKDGSPGATGATPRFTVTAVTGEAGTAASVTQSGIIAKLDGINSGICSLGYDQLAQMNGINTTIMQTGYGIQNGITQMGIAQMQDTNALSRQLGDCCCENRQGQAEIQYRMATDTCAITTGIANAARDIMDNNNANFRAINDRLTASELARKDEKIAEQNQIINSLNLAVSQRNQNDYLISQLKPCPVPAYSVPNPYNYNGQTCCGNYN